MSAHTRKHHISSSFAAQTLFVLDDDTMYAIPREVANQYIVEAGRSIVPDDSRTDNITADELFMDFDRKHGKVGALLKGLRAREDLSQIAFARKIGVTQANLSKMENGKRSIGKTVAKRIAKIFQIDYRIFLE
jgi:DNA-binding XRE family transcriptional regulator